jgi:phage head maturation protease
MANKKLLGDLITRVYPVELQTRSDGETGTITGIPIVFNARTDLGYFDEIIDPRALDGADLS